MLDNEKSYEIAITGANGFIGKYLVQALSKHKNVSLRLLVRKLPLNSQPSRNVSYIEGDLTKPETLKEFLLPGCIVINLAYSFAASNAENISAMKNLIDICAGSRIKRLVHCSTAAVYGRTNENVVDESSICNPRTDYGKTKLLIERLLSGASVGNYEYVNVRPTAVYGRDGQALMKLINNLENASQWSNYFRSCLFNVRSLNLVHVSNVVSAIIFLINSDKKVDNQTYIISEDFEVNNNYKYVEDFLLKRLTNRNFIFPVIHVPLFVLSLLLRILGRDAVNPRMLYDTKKLKLAGFTYSLSLDDGLADLCDWYKVNKSNNTTGGK